MQYKIAGWRKPLGKWWRAKSTLAWCAVGRKTSPAFGYARCQDLIINRDVTWDNGLWDKHMSHLECAVLECFYWLCVNLICALLAVYFKLFVPASIKRLDSLQETAWVSFFQVRCFQVLGRKSPTMAKMSLFQYSKSRFFFSVRGS